MSKVIIQFLDEKIEDYDKIVGSLLAESESELVKIVPYGLKEFIVTQLAHYLV